MHVQTAAHCIVLDMAQCYVKPSQGMIYMSDIIGVLELINTSCYITAVRPTSLPPKRLTVPINCVHTFRLLSQIESYAIPAVSCVFAYIVILFQTPINRDIYVSIGYVQLSERYYRTRDTTALTSVPISNYII